MFLARWPDRDFNVLAKSGEEFHKASNGEIPGAVADDQGYLRLPHAENFGDLDLCQICRVSCALRSSCSGLGRPRSAKTFPPPTDARATRSFLFFVLVFMVFPPFLHGP